MNKKHSKNTELTAEALDDYIFNRANKIVADLEQNREFKEAVTEFNRLPKLKRLFDFYVINFWLASVACELYYEHDDFQKICEGAEEGIIKSLESYEKSNQILGVTLKEFVKDKNELALLYREYPVGAETVIGFRALLAIIIPKRFSDYHSTLSFKDESVGLQRRSQYFCQHVFGKEYSDSPNCALILAPIFAMILASTLLAFSDYIVKMEQQIKNEGLEYDEEKVKEVLFDLIKTTHVKSTNANLKQSNEIADVKLSSDKVCYVIKFTDYSTAVLKVSWVNDYLDGKDSESKKLIEDALVMRAKFF